MPCKQLKDDQLVKRVQELLGTGTKSIIEACGYARQKKLLVEDFYSNLIAALSLNDLDIEDEDAEEFKKYLHENSGGRTPVLKDGIIVAFYWLRISDYALEREWDEDTWDCDNDEGNLDGPYEIGFITDRQSRFWGCYTFEEVIASCVIPDQLLSDLIRPTYLKLNADEIDRPINEFLLEYGEKPEDIFALAKRFGYL